MIWFIYVIKNHISQLSGQVIQPEGPLSSCDFALLSCVELSSVTGVLCAGRIGLAMITSVVGLVNLNVKDDAQVVEKTGYSSLHLYCFTLAPQEDTSEGRSLHVTQKGGSCMLQYSISGVVSRYAQCLCQIEIGSVVISYSIVTNIDIDESSLVLCCCTCSKSVLRFPEAAGGAWTGLITKELEFCSVCVIVIHRVYTGEDRTLPRFLFSVCYSVTEL